MAALYGVLFLWRQDERAEIVTLTNLQRLGNGTLLYAQDWDGRPPPARFPLEEGAARLWSDALKPYIEARHLINPANPFPETAKRGSGFAPPVPGFAMNVRFTELGSGRTTSLEGLELPGRTALFVGAGPSWKNPLDASEGQGTDGSPLYDDISDRDEKGCFRYPSSLRKRLPVGAADGHAELVEVENYVPTPAQPHDRRFGQIGSGIYNWNGGCPPGETDRPPHE